MNKKLDNIDELFFDTNKQKVLKFLAQNPSQSLMTSEIIKNANISKAGANIALRELVKVGLIKRSIKGKTHLYQVDFHNPLVKQFKVIETVVELYPLIKKLNGLSQQIILFGSASRGENLEDSDIDLFILTRSEEETRKLIKKFNQHKKIKAVLKNPSSFAKLEREDPTFYQEIQRGIILWERYE
ncbi:nucleotidyltransferase domain-containing protein [Candidatus Aerophobetes bacterium]|nr:nucleotidyltransferase domain-containing protein [Candidatus Aerophobetes bacterium]